MCKHHASALSRVILAITLLGIGYAFAVPGDLDPAFGIGGRVSLDFDSREVRIYSVIQQEDGKIVLAGLTDGFDFRDSTQLLLLRLDPDGSLDTGFGNDGMVIGAQPGEIAVVVIQQRNTMLAVAGRNADTANMMLWRFQSDGTPDASFGDGGSVEFGQGGADYASGLVEQPSGKLIVAGAVRGGGGTWDRDMMMARFDVDGRIDATFGSGGTEVVNFAIGTDEFPSALVEQPDGKLLLVGDHSTSASRGGGTVAAIRTTADGELDSSFGSGIQEVFIDYPYFTGLMHVSRSDAALQDDGKIVIGGALRADGEAKDFILRLTPDGSLDPSFGTDGIASVGVGGFSDSMGSIAVQADGRIVTAGSQDLAGYLLAQEMMLRRFLRDGKRDPSFGVDGRSTADFQDRVPYVVTRAMTRQTDGKLVIVGDGTRLPENRPAVTVARFVENDPDFAGLIGLVDRRRLVRAHAAAVDLSVRRTGGSTGMISVAYETVDGSALAGADYVPQAGRLEWANGDTSRKSITIALIQDANDEQEWFGLRLFDPTGGAMLTLQTATIWSGDVPELGLTLERATIGEADGSLTLSVVRSGSASGSLSVDFETYEIAAQGGSDFVSANGTVSWADGDMEEKTITLSIVNDDEVEDEEWFGVSLFNPAAGARVGTYGSATVTISDDDTGAAPPPATGGGGAGSGGSGALAWLELLGLAALTWLGRIITGPRTKQKRCSQWLKSAAEGLARHKSSPVSALAARVGT